MEFDYISLLTYIKSKLENRIHYVKHCIQVMDETRCSLDSEIVYMIIDACEEYYNDMCDDDMGDFSFEDYFELEYEDMFFDTIGEFNLI